MSETSSGKYCRVPHECSRGGLGWEFLSEATNLLDFIDPKKFEVDSWWVARVLAPGFSGDWVWAIRCENSEHRLAIGGGLEPVLWKLTPGVAWTSVIAVGRAEVIEYFENLGETNE